MSFVGTATKSSDPQRWIHTTNRQILVVECPQYVGWSPTQNNMMVHLKQRRMISNCLFFFALLLSSLKQNVPSVSILSGSTFLPSLLIFCPSCPRYRRTYPFLSSANTTPRPTGAVGEKKNAMGGSLTKIWTRLMGLKDWDAWPSGNGGFVQHSTHW